MNPLSLGVIGLSPGNGHPYSWSAIFNGYDPVYMENCGFPVIPRYLEKQHFPEDTIAEAKVTHVWAQSESIAAHVARAALVPNVVASFTDMIGEVDGVLLARDDAETHLKFAAPFLEAGIPVYIDKPLALTVAEAKQIFAMQRYPGQIFSCSALRYAKEFQLSEIQSEQIGRLRQIHATVPKDWGKYAIHVIEPLLLIAHDRGAVERTQCWHSDETTTLAVKYRGGFDALISTLGSTYAPLALRVLGESGWIDLFFEDTYAAFKSALHQFVQGIIHRDERTSSTFILEVIGLIERGRKL
ncbi:Gfo/Idh/MocA family oxidoreductase [Propionivibrio sp.]|uniref:Gfo/Idh/MocA family oxidoreductase n=1 Tax=Propionivibrio sp. TaxID=2212460 RepID=UPI00261B5EA2|nr:Gfo/Idh/MocA family oxidoreductase [Propionivibrio sp.]